MTQGVQRNKQTHPQRRAHPQSPVSPLFYVISFMITGPMATCQTAHGTRFNCIIGIRYVESGIIRAGDTRMLKRGVV